MSVAVLFGMLVPQERIRTIPIFQKTQSKVLHQFINNQANNQVDQKKQNEPFKIEQSTFTLHHQIDLTSVDPCCFRVAVTDIVIMDDGRLVMCLPRQNRLLIRDTDGSQIGNIHIHRNPLCVTAVNDSSVAVTLLEIQCIEMYDINNKLKLKSIAVPGMCWCWRGITTINNKLVIGCENKLQIIDHQIGKMVQTIQTDCKHSRLQGSGDRIFYWDHKTINNLCWYSYTDYRHHNLALPSPPRTMSTLQDGSLYVMCLDGSVQHLSSDCKHYEPVKTFQATPVCDELYYNLKQRSLVTIQNKNNHVTVYKEKLT